jgi:linoleoyl-CoA desaturase
MYLKTAIIAVWFFVSYALLVFVAPTWWLALPLALSFALAAAAVTFNIQHDGGHKAYSNYGWVNRLAALTMDLVGASSYLWRFKHGHFHHTCVNVAGHDTDIDTGFVARLAPQQRRRWGHRFQQFYMWLAYGLMAVRWHLMGDFQEIIAGRIGPHKIPRPRGWDLVLFILGKLFSLGLVLVIPLFFHPWWVVALFYLFVTGIMGVVMAVVFQLAHCVEEAEFPMPQKHTQRMERSWAEHQVETTVNFSGKSRILTWLLGGLNFQIEHHLFPRICHIHYPALSKIVQEVCRKFDVRYNVHKSLLAGIRSHFRWLRRMGMSDAM